MNFQGKETKKPEKIAVFHSDEDIKDLLDIIIKQKGISVVKENPKNFQTGNADIEKFFEENNPDTIVWEIRPPYDTNWEYFKSIRYSKFGAERRFVLITAHSKMLEETTKEELKEYKIINEPFEIDEMTDILMNEPEIKGELENLNPNQKELNINKEKEI